jgi:hypothetical protein
MMQTVLWVMAVFIVLHALMACRLKLWTVHTSVAVTVALFATVVALQAPHA